MHIFICERLIYVQHIYITHVKRIINNTCLTYEKKHTVESLEFVVARFSWKSWVPLILEFTFSTKQ